MDCFQSRGVVRNSFALDCVRVPWRRYLIALELLYNHNNFFYTDSFASTVYKKMFEGGKKQQQSTLPRWARSCNVAIAEFAMLTAALDLSSSCVVPWYSCRCTSTRLWSRLSRNGMISSMTCWEVCILIEDLSHADGWTRAWRYTISRNRMWVESNGRFATALNVAPSGGVYWSNALTIWETDIALRSKSM